MKVRISMKTPDCIQNTIDEHLSYVPTEKEAKLESDIRRVSKKFFMYEEYVILELDTEAETCVVVAKG
jgi:hypothetical protein